MTRIFLLPLLSLLLLPLHAQTVEHVAELNPQQKAATKHLVLTGTLTTTGNSDFRQMRDLCWQLECADLSRAHCAALPANAFHSRHRLLRVLLPQDVERIGSQAFFACDALQTITLPATLQSVGDGAFNRCNALQTLVVEGTPQLGAFAFAGCTALKEVRLTSPTPPAAQATTFEGIDRAKCRLLVPAGAEEAYRKAEGWSRFYAEASAPYTVCNPSACLVPLPASMTLDGGSKTLRVKAKWLIDAPAALANESRQARSLIDARLKGCSLHGRATLTLRTDSTLPDAEAYTLQVHSKGVSITGATAAGVFYGLQTLDQLLRADASAACCDAVPLLTIDDQPRTHVRELMLDPARTFIPFEELKRFVAEMARYKYNALHLHLVDDQAWRIEIKAYPELTAKASARVGMDDMLVPIAGFYTQEQMRDLVAYAASYHVQVVPEIEMPGHEVAAIHVLPQLTCGAKQVPIRTTCGVSNELLCPGNEFTYTFLGRVFSELADIFPSPYVHLGGDEAGNPALDCWTHCDRCRALKRQLGITTDDRSENWRLQQYLFDRVIDTLRTKHGKTPMFWYETDFKRIQPGCVTFSWRHGLTRAAAEAAVRNQARIMFCPGEHCYFDYPMAQGDMPEVNWGMPLIPLKQTYDLDPAWGMGEDFERHNLFGVAGTLWSECINTPERIYYQAFPRGIALAEVGWSPQAARRYPDFLRRLRPALTDMQRRGVTHSMAF